MKVRPAFLLLGLLALLTAVTAGVFAEVRQFEFVTWDDDINVYQNPHLRPLSGDNLARFWSAPFEYLYVPLTYTVWAVVAHFRGLDPAAFHLTNLAAHLLAAMVVFAILRLLVRQEVPAAVGALLFAVHPVQVEAVAWVTGLKDVLGGLLFLTAVWLYLLHARAGMDDGAGKWGRVWYALATFAYVLALLAKPAAAAAPLVAWALDRWVLQRPVPACTRASLPWVLIALPWMLLTRLAQPETALPAVPLWGRPLIAGDSLAFYLGKLVRPFPLAPDYGRTPEWVLGHRWGSVAWLLPAAGLFWIWTRRDKHPWMLAAAASFVAPLLLVSGVVPFAFQEFSTVADRYLYPAMLGPALCAAWLLARWPRAVPAALLVCVVLGTGSAVQARNWRDSVTLYAHTVRANPRSWMAHNNLGEAYGRAGNVALAIRHFEAAVRIRPRYDDAHYNLGVALAIQGRSLEAMEHYREALDIRPSYWQAHQNLAGLLSRAGYPEEAARHYREVLRLNPAFAPARQQLEALGQGSGLGRE